MKHRLSASKCKGGEHWHYILGSDDCKSANTKGCKVRGLVHFSARAYCDGLYALAENMDLTPSRRSSLAKGDRIG